MYPSTSSCRLAISFLTALATLPICSSAASSPDSKASDVDPCTIHSSLTGSFYDVRPLTLTTDGTKTQSATNESYHARGYDYGANFTINICGPVVEELDDVEGVSRKQWANISAFYKDPTDDMIYSLGEVNRNLTVRGRKLLLNYTNGSPCPDLDELGNPLMISSSSKTSRRKSTILSFTCDTSPALSTTPRISFLASPDHCSYIFEVRSRYACAGATPSHEKGTLGPAGVFAMILVIGLLAYLVGGIVYQRNVMHQRGWRQLPNYGLWAGIFSFISVSFLIILKASRLTLFRTCFRLSLALALTDSHQPLDCSILKEVAMFELGRKIAEMAELEEAEPVTMKTG